MNADAHAIYQNTLDKLTGALLTKDQAVWARYIRLPSFMSTSEGKLVHETPQDLATGLSDYGEALDKLGVVDMDRICDTAQFVKENVIVGYHTTRLHTDAGKTFPAFTVRLVMQMNDGIWQVAKSNVALGGANWNGLPLNQTTLLNKRQKETDVSRRIMLQTVVDRADGLFLSGDFEGWYDCVSMPLVFETRSGTDIFETTDALRADFEIYQQEFHIHHVTDVARVAKRTEQIDGETMMGTFRVHVLSGALHIVPPWDGDIEFKRVDGLWRVSKLLGALGHLNWRNN